MNAAQKAHESFSADLNKRIGVAIKEGANLEAVILELELAKLFCYENYTARRRIAAAQQMATEQQAKTGDLTNIIIPLKGKTNASSN